MFKNFAKEFFLSVLIYGFCSFFLGIPVIIYWLLTEAEYLFFGVIAFGLFLFVVAYNVHKEMVEESEKSHKAEIQRIISETEIKLTSIEQNLKVVEHKENMWRQLLNERAAGFPSLFTNIAYYEKLIDDELAGYLRNKSHPAVSASEVIKSEAKRRREAEFEKRTMQAIIEYYENIAPFLLELKEDLEIPDESVFENYSEEEREDYVTKYLTKEEYHKLPSIERNQMALDRFWKRPNKSNWLLGLLYERYTGYLYESRGYNVKYHGAKEGKKDLGRDLICEKGNEILVVQCKYWSQFKTIHEKHIFQLFGTTFQYKYQLEQENKNKKIKAIFHTSTNLSEIARKFAEELNIEVKENIKLDRSYPCIKCNIGRISEEKIYHLPFDQQYDNIVIEPKRGEFYCCTVKEAENAGFRRAFRYKGINKS